MFYFLKCEHYLNFYYIKIINFYLLSLLQHLQKIRPDVESQGDVNKVPLFMITSFLYAIDLDCMNNAQQICNGNYNYENLCV